MAERYVVTGGGGFLGKAICKRLKSEGHHVISIARGNYPELEALGIETIRCDISRDTEILFQGCKEATCVFHTAAKVEMWGGYHEFFQINVVGTRNIIEACKRAGVRNLVFTSSPSVVADGSNLNGIDESYPYPEHFEAYYPETKWIAEQEVLDANSETLRTVALRPHLIYGPGDTNLECLVVKKAKEGRLFRIGKGDNLVDFSFIDDCVEAHVLASHALEDNPTCRGKAYFISQGVPTKLWEWIDAALVRNNLPPVKRSVPAWLAIAAGAVMDWCARYSPISFEPPFTKFLAQEMATNHYFNIERAQRDLGYVPRKKDILSW